MTCSVVVVVVATVVAVVVVVVIVVFIVVVADIVVGIVVFIVVVVVSVVVVVVVVVIFEACTAGTVATGSHVEVVAVDVFDVLTIVGVMVDADLQVDRLLWLLWQRLV